MRSGLLRGAVTAAVTLVALLAITVAALAGGAGAFAQAAPSVLATASIPASYLALFQSAAATCPGLSWTVLAAIGEVESGFGADTGVSRAGAQGPMQFEPASFAAYDHPVRADPAPNPPGSPDPPAITDPGDAVYAAARMLCADGAADPAELSSAVWDYNHAGWYVAEVLALARSYAADGGAVGAQVAAFAQSQVGTPYVWGGETEGVGFDCSGLAQWAWAQVAVSLPRVARDQYDAGPQVAVSDLVPGDLVFFGASAESVEHVGIYIGDGEMVDAPHTGADVRVEPVTGFVPPYVGATDPALSS